MEDQPNPPASPAPQKKGNTKFLLGIVLFGAAILIGAGGVVSLMPKFPELLPLPAPSPQPDETARQEIATLKGQLDALNEKIAQIQPSDRPSSALEQKLQLIQNRLDNAKAFDQAERHNTLTLAFAFWDLRLRAQQGKPFAEQRAALRAAAADEADFLALLAPLDPYANASTPTLEALKLAFANTAKNIEPDIPEDTVAQWTHRIKKILRPLIAIHAEHDPRLTSIEARLAANDLAGALAALNETPENIRTALASWQAEAQARLALDNAVDALMHFFFSPVTPRTAP